MDKSAPSKKPYAIKLPNYNQNYETDDLHPQDHKQELDSVWDGESIRRDK